MLGALQGEFWKQFQDFEIGKNEMHAICCPLTCSVENTPSDVQLKAIDLQCDTGGALTLLSKSKLHKYGGVLVHA